LAARLHVGWGKFLPNLNNQSAIQRALCGGGGFDKKMSAARVGEIAPVNPRKHSGQRVQTTLGGARVPKGEGRKVRIGCATAIPGISNRKLTPSKKYNLFFPVALIVIWATLMALRFKQLHPIFGSPQSRHPRLEAAISTWLRVYFKTHRFM